MSLNTHFTNLLISLVIIVSSFGAYALEKPRGQYIQPDNLFPKIKMVTTLGEMIIELDRSRAPLTVDNFLSYVEAKRYDNTIFHRLEPEFVLQGGGYYSDGDSIKEFEQIFNESGNGLKNEQGTIAMARQLSPHTATSQFFFNLVDNESLDPGRNWGYTVFGYIFEGDEVLEKAQEIGGDYSEKHGWPTFPKKEIKIISVEILPEG